VSIEKLTASVSDFFASDRIRAGVVASKLIGAWYVSVARYPSDHLSKQIVCSAKGSTYEEAVTACMLAWLAHTRNTKELAKELGANLGAACRRVLP
jgi:hypothetical protein